MNTLINSFVFKDKKIELNLAYNRVLKFYKLMKDTDASNQEKIKITLKLFIKNYDEIARAVRHSMVVIDAEKHNLNYRQSFIDNGIAQLKATYQGGATKGASTIVSRAKSEIRIDKRKDYYKIDSREMLKKMFSEETITKQIQQLL